MSKTVPLALLKELRRIVGPRHVLSGRASAEVYSYDASLAVAAPELAVLPGTTAETAAVVRAASAASVACTPRGFGTNLSGGSIALQGSVVLGLTRLNRILDIQPRRRTARVQCGVTNLDLQNALAPLGYYYAPDPASQKVSTLGGNVAENSGGPHCLKYGVTTNHILGLEVVLSGGEVLWLGGPALDPPGYDLRGLFVASEGTFGIATEVVVRILPKPEAVVTLLAVYDRQLDAAHSVAEIIAAGIVPATLEMMDGLVLRAVEDSFSCGYPRDAAAVLIIEVEGPAAGLRQQAEKIKAVCTAQGCRSIREAANAAERAQLWAGRRGAFGAVARIASNYLVADCTVPRSRLPEALKQVLEIAGRHGCTCGNVFHAGDGNMHPLLLFDARQSDEVRRVHEAGREITQACVNLGGTITGEHGVGVEKLESMRLVFSEDDLAFQRTIRTVFDPGDHFNPGKVVPEPANGRSSATPPALPLAVSREPADELVPDNASAACEIVRWAIAGNKSLLPVGGARWADFGNRSPTPVIPLHSRKLSAVVEYDAPNQVAAFGAGMKLAAAQAVLAANRQWLPLRPPLGGQSTLGGIVALGACGPERLAYGAPRDRLLGLRFVSAAGEPISVGGRVVKNVAGYDVTRLMAGSAGTLGFLTELTFRLAAVPEWCRAVHGCGTLRECAAAAAALLGSALEPTLLTAAPEGESALWRFTAAFEGLQTTVRAQLEGARAALEKAGLRLEGEEDYPLLDGPRSGDCPRLAACEFVLRADLPIGALAEMMEAAPRAGQTCVLVDFGCGRIRCGAASFAENDWAEWCAQAAAAQGYAVLERAPAEFKCGRDVFGPARPEWNLVHRLKQALDPRGLFAPGRLPGGM